MSIIIKITLLILAMLDGTCAESKPQQNQKCYYTFIDNNNQQTYLICDNFNAWSELNEELVSINKSLSPNPVIFKPNQPIPLSSELNMSLVAYNSSTPDLQRYSVYTILGVNVYPWPPCFSCIAKILSLYLSTMKFYVNGTSPADYTCTPDLIPDNTATSVSLLSTYINGINVNFGNKFDSGSNAVCPFLFKNAKLSSGFDLQNQVNSFLFVNIFSFQQVNDTTI
jgi:hypothetical protein